MSWSRKEQRLSVHPTPTELEAFAKGDLPPTLFRRVARHLFRGCAPCNVLLRPHYQHLLPSSLSPEPQIHGLGITDDYLDRIFSAFRSYRRYLRREETRQRKIAARLAMGGGLQALTEGPEVPLRGLGALQALLDRSWVVRHENPQEMVELARFAVEVARNLSPRWHDEREIADWQARTWGEYANALRTADDLDEAERAFGFAFAFLLQGTGDLQVKARLYDLHASYLGTRRWFALAFAAFDVLHETYQELGDKHLAGRALLIKAIYLHYNGQSEDAIVITARGLAMIDPSRDPNLSCLAIHNHLWFLVACGRFQDARIELFRRRADLANIEGRVIAVKLRWLEAQISSGFRDWAYAEKLFCEVRQAFEEERMGFHAALASLDLALVWMHLGRYEEATAVVLEAHDIFVDLRIQREAFGAMMVLKEAFERQLGTIGLLEDAVEFLRRWYVNPDERFVPRGE